MCTGGGIGGILGGLAGTGLSIFAPELGIPLFLGAGLGSGAGTFLGDVESGKSAGSSILPSLESAGISGALAGVGNVAAGGDFFGAPASSLSGIVGSTAPTAATTAATDVAAAAAPTTATQLASTAAPTIAGTTTASAAGAPAAGGGAAIGDVSTALPTATGGAGSAGANLGSAAIGGGGQPWGADFAKGIWSSGMTGGGEALSAANTVPLGTPLTAANVNALGSEAGGLPATAGVAPGTTVVPSSITNPAFTTSNIQSAWDKMATAGDGNWFSNLFKAQPGGSFLSKGLAGEPGSIAADLTKPSTLITGGAALLPLLQGNTIPGLSGIQNQAKTLNAMGTPLAQSLTTGQLAPGAQSALDAATRSAAAQVRSRYAAMGLSGSSQEADELGTVQVNAQTAKFDELLKQTQQGITEMGMASPILQNIMQTQLAQDREQQQAIARLAAALAGSTGTEKTTA